MNFITNDTLVCTPNYVRPLEFAPYGAASIAMAWLTAFPAVGHKSVATMQSAAQPVVPTAEKYGAVLVSTN
jgi:hypothetical protein